LATSGDVDLFSADSAPLGQAQKSMPAARTYPRRRDR